MLILIGTVPMAYALNHALPASYTQDFVAVSEQSARTLDHYAPGAAFEGDPREEVASFVRNRALAPATIPALSRFVADISRDMAHFKELKNVPAEQSRNFRNYLYLVGEAIRLIDKTGQPKVAAEDYGDPEERYKKYVDMRATRFIPGWVKVAVAIAPLAIDGTMVGWKRIVVTVGKKIGKDHLTYAHRARAPRSPRW